MDETISRSEQKRRFRRIEEVAQELTELTDNDLKRFPGDQDIRAELRAIRGLSGGARKRQVKHLAKILRQGESLEMIYDFLSRRRGSQLREKSLFHEAEHLRDALINEAMADFQRSRALQREWEPDWRSELLGSATARYQDLDEDALRKTIYQYVRSHNRLYYRELFRMIKAAFDRFERDRRLEKGDDEGLEKDGG